MKPSIRTIFLASVILLSSINAEDSSPIPIEATMRLPHLDASTNGKVELIVAVDRFGDVVTVNSLSTTSKELYKSFKDAIQSWKFQPAQSGGSAYLGTYEHKFMVENGQVVEFVNDEKFATKTFKEKNESKSSIAHGIVPPSPKLVRKEKPQLSLEYYNINGFVSLKFGVSPQGKVDNVSVVEYSHHELIQPTLEAARKWRFDNAPANAQAVIRNYQTTLKFPGASARQKSKWISNYDFDIAATPVRFQMPQFDPSQFSSGTRLSATLSIDEHGYVANVHVASSVDKNYTEELTKAFYGWKFSPALKDGEAVQSENVGAFVMTETGLQPLQKTMDKHPEVVVSETPKLRSSLSQLEGYVLISMSIDKQGNVFDARIIESTNEKLDKPSVDASYKWKFLPGIREDKAIESNIVIPFVYPLNS
ncbi:energy transducer TonB [Puniceicoccaceae bacterium K14]|nr:energy transducer TonB [Puniceicoccaceae bacterium K14]